MRQYEYRRPTAARAGAGRTVQSTKVFPDKTVAGSRSVAVLKPLRKKCQVAGFFTQLMHHPPESTLLPGKRVHGPCESPDLP